MLQLNYSSSGIENHAVYIDSNYTGSEVQIYLSSSFSGDITGFKSDITSNKTNEYGGWILLEVDKIDVPTKSGQYDCNIYQLEPGSSDGTWLGAKLKWTEVTETWYDYNIYVGIGYTWSEAPDTWIQVTDTWRNYGPKEVIGSLLAYERVLVSGSDYDTINKYNFKDKSNYTVYNG
tara:strand:- start:1745 stop:2272 length:528 start_codon:yes stop_codon:yes gene_type:complete